MDTATDPDHAILTLAQWLSPAYPIGAFTYSHGLETAISDGLVTDSGTLDGWVTDVLKHGSGWNDALFLAAAHNTPDPEPIDQVARAFAASRERLLEADAQGSAFAAITREIWALDLPNLTYPVAVGRAASLVGLPLAPCSALFLQAFVGNLASVGQRLIPIGQTDAQRLVHNLSELCKDIAAATTHGDLEALTSTAFLGDIAAMRHETEQRRVFRT